MVQLEYLCILLQYLSVSRHLNTENKSSCSKLAEIVFAWETCLQNSILA